ncbi:MAG: LamG domain-containing protein [Candidatus Poribacteria bacterium]|nr:LamG domain-containing protein [Candidatus Poribacteria bacterium]
MMAVQKSLVGILITLIGLLCTTSISVANVLEDALLAAWLFDENGGDTAEDASGNGHDGDIMGAKRVPGKTGRALDFDGNGNIVEIRHDDIFNLTEYTISAWVKTNPNGKWQTVLGKEPIAGRPRNYGVFIAGDTKLLGVNYTTGANWKTAFSTTVAADGKWHHVAATYDGKVLRAYIDGEMEGETATDIPPDHNTEPIRIGRWGAPRGDYWAGVLDDVAIFSQALTENEIQDITMKLRDALSVEASGKLTVTWGRIKQSMAEQN